MKTDFNINTLTRPNVKALKPYSSARDEFKEFSNDMIFLDANENPFENGVNRYPDPQQNKVKQLLSKKSNVGTDQILLGNGSDEVLDLIFRAFCEPKEDNIITMPPTYGMYEVLANINTVENRKIPLTNQFQPNLEGIFSMADFKSKIIFICSPNNPTGNSFSAESIEKLLELFEGLVVIDEAYIDFSEQESWVTRLNDFPNLIVTQTLSKAYGMAGIRLGICYASIEIISVLNKIKPPYNVNELTQQKAIERLVNMDAVANEIESIKYERELLVSELNNVPFISRIYPSDANFILVKVDDAIKRYEQLIEKGIVIRNRAKEELCENCLRFTVGTPKENKKLIQILKQIS